MLQLHWDGVKAGTNADMDSPHKLYSPQGWQRLQEGLDRVYADFTQKVGAGRNLSPEKVREVAKGQIWSGADAKARGLVDELGGYSVAIRLAREAAQIPSEQQIRVEEYPAPENPLEVLFEEVLSGGEVRAAEAERLATLLRIAEWLEPIAAAVAPLVASSTAPQLMTPVRPAAN
jgi:protease-4